MALFQPVNQVRLTNVAVIKYKTHGIRFEVACYKNKILSWRSGAEKDIDEVLQIPHVFANVSKGLYANKEDLMKAFNITDELEICKIILDKGEVQVSDKERQTFLENITKDIAAFIANNVIDLKTGRPLTVTMIQAVLKEIKFSARLEDSAKKQGLKAIDLILSKHGDRIGRRHMHLEAEIPVESMTELDHLLKTIQGKILEKSAVKANMITVSFTCEPSHYRTLESLIKNLSGILHVSSEAINEVGNTRQQRHHEEEDDEAQLIVSHEGVMAAIHMTDEEKSRIKSNIHHTNNTQSNFDKLLDGTTITNSNAISTGTAGITTQHQVRSDRPPKARPTVDRNVVNANKKIIEEVEEIEKPKPRDKTESVIPTETTPVDTTLKPSLCSACQVTFYGTAAFREHYRTDWHSHNVRRKVKGLEPVAEDSNWEKMFNN